ncbi:MAG: FAD-dependent oxidoreductase [Dehalococcoidales bacterium]|nr:MAG: FAD-dependent oxidoreductase [Dehalococcoidales bacterium]
MSGDFKRLFESGQIGKMHLKNRIVMPPMGTGYHEKGGYVSQRLIDYLEARAKGGVGLIIIEVTAPSIECNVSNFQLTLGDDSYISGFRKLAEAVHQHGAKIAVQLQHSSWELMNGDRVQVGPSAIMVPARVMGVSGTPPHELTPDEISQRVQWFAAAAGRAQKAGLDGVEVHGAHQYLVASFLSPSTNQRNDKYGGTVENRARFMIEILQAVREKVGSDYPVWPRLNGQEFGFEDGITIEETRQTVPMFVAAGADGIHVSAYGAYSFAIRAPICDMPGFLVPIADEVKKVTSVPVIAVGRLDAELGEQILEQGKADFISIGRRLMADPELPNKAAAGKVDEITPCINCMDCIERPVTEGRGTACAVNAAMGQEREYRIQPAEKVKKIVVVGGGPAGMEAARVAALRGHRVVLYEKAPKLGGQLIVAALPPYKEELALLTEYMSDQLTRAGVDTLLNVEVTPDVIIGDKPDAVVVAAGGTPIIPDMPGINSTNVVTAQDVLSGREVGQNAVIIGGGMVGCETGHFLSEKGKHVTIVEMLKRMANDVSPMVRRRLLDGLRAKQVVMITGTSYEQIAENSVIVTTEEKKSEIPADSIILAVGYQPNNELYQALEGKVPEVYCIGDAARPQRIREAINDGYRAGLSV